MKIYFKLILTIIALALVGCGGGETTNTSNANTSPANNAALTSDNTGLETTKKPVGETTNNAPTLTPVVNAYYEALRKKDDALLRSILTQEFISSLEKDMKAEGKSGLAAYMAETDTIPDKPVEVRNEKIDGNDAVAEIKGGAYINWTPFAFRNEGGKWKFTGGSPVLK